MPVLIGGNWEAPFWGAEKTFITGQDMLGMQNTSISTYASLLPGLTNLTRRMRYYGFYIWLLEQYAKEKGKVSVTEYQQFIRRGELLLAFIMSHNFPDEQGVVGSLYAKNYLNERKDIIDIAGGADRNTGLRSYWKYSTGAFGQYYQGALTATGLIAPSEKESRISVCTPTYGRILAKHFEKTISEDTRKRYVHIIDSGKASIKDIVSLGEEFSLTEIVPDTDEWRFYIDLLFGHDYPTIEMPAGHATFRRETILLYLEYLNDSSLNTPEDWFPGSFLLQKWQKKPFVDYTASTGWYYYALNEYAHYSMETVLWALLVELNNRGQSLLPMIIKDFVQGACMTIMSDTIHVKSADTMSFDKFSEMLYDEGFQPLSHTDAIQRIGEDAAFKSVAHAMCVLGLIFKHDKGQIEKLRAYSRKHGMNRDGDVVQLLEWIVRHKKLNLSDFVERLLLQQVINRHIEVAMRKMRNRNENTLKFIFEDNMLKPVGIAEPVWTGPRILSLHQFLIDLKLVDNQQKLTALGQKVLKEKLQ
ncbi:MAG: hypothetical protein HZB30_10695 [Nitrospirae bacterium]|nr:hypothetical protein [Nitrospirota bacterium]